MDMPLGYTNETLALQNASRVYTQTSAHAVKIEGGISRAPIIRALTQNSIAVMGHIGLIPHLLEARVDIRYEDARKKRFKHLSKTPKQLKAQVLLVLSLKGW